MTREPEWSIERVRKSHKRNAFSCGNTDLDEYLKRFARQNDATGLGRTYVVTRPGSDLVLGYYTLSAGAVMFSDLPPESARSLPRYPIPVVLIARLAVDIQVRGQGLGRNLLTDALHRSLAVSDQLGVYAVAVEAKNDQACSFYRKYGFESLRDDKLHLFLSIKKVRQAFS
jgi:ribosomal protein S18 acetylase RimI-like enzyme